MSLGDIERELYYRGEMSLRKLRKIEEELTDGNEQPNDAGADNGRGAGDKRKTETARAYLRIGRFRLLV